MQRTGHGSRLCEFLQDHHDEILAEWERRLREAAGGRTLPLPAATLRDHVPALLRRIAAVVRTPGEAPSVFLDDLPDQHAFDRLAAGFDPSAAAGELALLRDVVHRLWGPRAAGLDATLVVSELRRFDQAVDEVVSRSVDRYARARERTLLALDRVSSAAEGGGDVDRLLGRLLEVLLETTATADSAYLLLRDDPRSDVLRVRAAAGTNVRLSDGFTLRIGEGFAGEVARRRKPMLVHDAAREPRVLNPALRDDEGVHALLGVPLVHDGEVIGVAKLASRTAYDFSEDDKHLFLAMTQRATALIVQAQLLARERAARDAERRSALELGQVMEASPDMLVVAGADGFLKRVNPAMSTILGHSEAELLARPYLDLVHPEDRDRVVAEVRKVVAGTPSHRFVFRLIRKDGAVIWVSFNASGEPGAEVFIAVGRDVTQEREHSEFEQQLIGIVSHDLRNPLHTIVLASASLLGRAASLDPATATAARRIHAAGERAVALIRDLLDFTRARRAGGLVLDPRPLDLHELVRQTAEEVHLLYPHRALELDQRGRGDGAWDPARMAQVAENLVSNAFKYGSPDFPVVVRTLGEDGSIRLEVHNAGKSIPPDLLPHLFEPLWRGQRSDSIGGVAGIGLGLYIVDHVVRAHGGTIHVRSTPDHGTTFTVLLPRAPPAARDLRA